MATIDQTGYAPLFINKYVLAQLEEFGVITGNDLIDPIVPATNPTSIIELYDNFIGSESPLLIIYDRMARYRPSPFYRHKREQLIYSLHSDSLDTIYNATRVILEALDRMDASGEDVNRWVKDNPDLTPKNVFFHSFKAFQVDETRDVLELASVRVGFVNKIIIEYDYHTTDSYYA